MKLAALTALGLTLVMACNQADEAQHAPPVLEAAGNPTGPNVSSAPGPEAYAALHHAALKPDEGGWGEAMAALTLHGDGFTLVHLERIDWESMGVEARDVLNRTIAKIRQRVDSEDAEQFRLGIARMFERAAWTDLKCDRLETTLPAWAKDAVTLRFENPGIRRELERINREFVATGQDEVGFGTLTERVRKYAADVLAAMQDR